MHQTPAVSVVTPAYNEEQNLPLLHDALRHALEPLHLSWEWIIVDDHSADGTFAAISRLADQDARVHGLRLGRNCGSHLAIACGLHQARGECAVVLASDLQDPPDVIGRLVAEWRKGAQIVWAARVGREGQPATSTGFARLYYFLMRRVVGMQNMPTTGADFFLVDQAVIHAFRRFRERNVNVLALLTWMGFRQTTITYEKKARRHGTSGWTLEKKVKLVIDSVVSFSYLPLRLVSVSGAAIGAAGLCALGWGAVRWSGGAPPDGWAVASGLVLFLGGVQLVTLGLLGEYVWRALDEARGRPPYLIEATVGTPRVVPEAAAL